MSVTHPEIMVVDDEPGMRITLEAIIEDEGYDVVGVEDGYKAVEMAEASPFDLIFMDIKMPGIDGVETYRRIKAINPGSIVFMLTAFAVEELVKQALEEGAYAVIYKPFAAEQIIDVLKAVLRTTCVLVVDDRPTDREVMRGILEESGYQVSEAHDGRQAISMVSASHYDIVLMDIRMPGMDGITAF